MHNSSFFDRARLSSYTAPARSSETLFFLYQAHALFQFPAGFSRARRWAGRGAGAAAPTARMRRAG